MITGGLLFFVLLSIITHLFRLPFSLYDTFVIENHYGFNTMTFKIWVLDLLKGIAISAALGGLVLWLLLVLVVHGGTLWWVWAWVLLGLFELLLLWLFPLVIAPLFNKFDPVEDTDLKRQIEALMEKVGLRVRGVFRMDASKRSKHTNAYFTGLGRSKRIVLYDTLLTSHTAREILAVLAHEIGHWKKRHVLKQLLLAEGVSLAGFYAVGKFLKWEILYEAFGFQEAVPFVGLFLIGTCAGLVGFFAQPLESIISRWFEREADDFAVNLVKGADPLCQSLKRLAADNLSNLNPHPLYAWFYYSHPPLVERISRLRKVEQPLFCSCHAELGSASHKRKPSEPLKQVQGDKKDEIQNLLWRRVVYKNTWRRYLWKESIDRSPISASQESRTQTMLWRLFTNVCRRAI